MQSLQNIRRQNKACESAPLRGLLVAELAFGGGSPNEFDFGYRMGVSYEKIHLHFVGFGWHADPLAYGDLQLFSVRAGKDGDARTDRGGLATLRWAAAGLEL